MTASIVKSNKQKKGEFLVPKQWFMLIKSPPKRKWYTILELDNFYIFDAEEIFQQTVSNRVMQKFLKCKFSDTKKGTSFNPILL